jgi:hypothetical protein
MDATPGFEADIRPLFRERDRRSMLFLFDLWDYDAVREHADDILAQTAAGDMPCDDTWPAEQVERFRAWMTGGFLP